MPRILRSQGITKLFPPILAAPAVTFIAPPIQTRLVAVSTARGSVGRYPTKGWAPWATEGRTGILDNFNRPDGLLGGNWTKPFEDAQTTFQPLNGQGWNTAGSGFAGAWWSQQTFGPNTEVFCNATSSGPDGDFYLYARVTNPGLTLTNGYAVEFNIVADTVRIWRVDSHVYTSLAGPVSVTIVDGDLIGFTVVGSKITAYVNGVPVAAATDTTYSAAGFIAVDLAPGFIENFGGGTLQAFGPRYWQHGLKPPAVIGPTPQPNARPIKTVGAAQASRRHQSRGTIHVLRPPATLVAATAFVASPLRAANIHVRPARTVWTLRKPTTLRVFAGPKSWLTKTRPRPTTHVLRPAAVVLVPQVEQQLRTLRVTLVRGRPGKTRYLLRPAQVVLVPSVELREETIRVALVRGRAGRARWLLRPPQTLQVFPGPRAALVRSRPRKTRYVLEPPQALQTFQGPSRSLTATRPRHTTRVLSPPTVVQPRAEFVAPPPRVWNVHIRPPRTRADLFPPAVVAPRPLAPPLQSRLVRTRPQHTVYRLEPPTTLVVFSGPRSILTRARPRPTITRLRPAAVVRVPSVEQQIRTVRVALVRTRPRATTRLLRPPAVVTIPRVAEDTLRVLTVRGRRPKATYQLFRPATLEPFSIQLREQTIRVRLVQIRPRKTTLKLRPPAKLAAVTFQAGKPWLVRARPQHTATVLRPPAVLRVFTTGEQALVRIRPRHTTTLLRPAAKVLVPSVEQQRRTLRVALVETRPRPTTTALRPVVIFQPEVTQQRVALTRTRPRHTLTALRRPSGREFVPEAIRSVLTRTRPRHTITRLYRPTAVTPFVEPVSTFIRSWITRIRPPGTLWQLFPPRRLKNVPGHACLTDQAANQACLTDQLAAEACLTDEESVTEACLTNQEAVTACLVDMSAAQATLRDEE